ncbi:MAG: terminase large subunit domain-containing protein, partial [Paraclostridium sp.]
MHKNRKCIEDTIAYKYAYKVANRQIVAGKYIIMECERFLDDIEECRNPNSEWYFDLGIYNFIIGFQSLFKFADGIKAGQPLELAEFQVWIISCLFCFKHRKEDYTKYSKAYVQVSRKQGKSFLLGFIVLIKSLLEKYGQYYICATKKDQASIVVKEVKKLLDMSDKCVRDRFSIYGKASINKILNDVTLSEIAPLSADANTL